VVSDNGLEERDKRREETEGERRIKKSTKDNRMET
jgi:hypothetical protein